MKWLVLSATVLRKPTICPRFCRLCEKETQTMRKLKRVIERAIIVLTAVAAMYGISHGQEDTRIEILPTIVVGQAYEDNIFLSRDNKQSDFITTVSPGILARVNSVKTKLDLEYFPTWVWYHEFSDRDTVRHNAKMDLVHRFTRRFSVELKENYVRTDDPYLQALDPSLRTQNMRRDRNIYERNSASGSMKYQFGREDLVEFGVVHQLLENQDQFLDDASEFGVFGSLAFWLNARNGIEVDLRFSGYDFNREIGPSEREDLKGYDPKGRYIHRFNRNTKVFGEYAIYLRDFEGQQPNYEIHEVRAGLEHSWGRNWNFALETGYFQPSGDLSGGALFSSRIRRKIKDGSLRFGVETGWDEGFLETDTRGFTKFWGASGGVDYQVVEDLRGNANISYRENDREFETNLDDSILYGSLGLRYEVTRLIFLGLQYDYLDVSSEEEANEYVDNRFLLTLSASYALYPFGDRPSRRGSPSIPGGTTGMR
ncbi:MAG: hypothetical protein CVU57_12770 [Deltaproteobacteria bacterium HGW-Deltaproteobacteria-15]|nr:MAG: hypothetical protein CVU57_12770 [Deltaproteobacteria bacterium HGW-Deltaproteobacteria-15]